MTPTDTLVGLVRGSRLPGTVVVEGQTLVAVLAHGEVLTATDELVVPVDG